MASRLHARCLDAGRLALIALAASSSLAAADPFQDSISQIEGATSLELAVEIGAHLSAGTLVNLLDQPLQTAGDDPLRGVLFLISIYEDGMMVTGSGTVVRSDIGATARVLTAGHVTALEAPASGAALVEVLAFDTEGRFRAILGPKVLSGSGPGDSPARAESVASDMAVLEVLDLAPELREDEWTALARTVAPRQSEGLLLLQPGAGSMIANPGMSGAAVFDANGEIVGVASYAAHLESDKLGEGGSDFLSRLTSDIDPLSPTADVGAALSQELEAVQSPNREGRKHNGIILASPVILDEILEALGASVAEVNHVGGGVQPALVAGFPDRELRSEPVGFLELDLISALEAARDRQIVNVDYGAGVELPAI